MEAVIRGIVMYLALLLIVRASGRRALAQMTAFDLILVLIISETTQQALVGEDFSIANAVVLIITLFGIDIVLSYVKAASPLADRLIDGVPTLLVSDGRPDTRALRRSRVQIEDVLSAARATQGLENLAEIKYAVLEPGGHISIIPLRSER